jgi:PAS domain S-box-containing protein
MAESHELCGARCILGDPGLLAPPPGASSAGWSSARDERQQHCLRCEVFPLLGVIGMARRHERGPVGAADVMLLESIAQSVAPMVENARLVQELRRGERFRNHVLDSMTGSLLAVNMRGEILTSNRAAQSLLVATESEIQGQPFGSWFGKDAESALRATLDRGQEIQGFETILPVRDDRMIPIRLSTSLLRDERRVVYGAIVTFVDLTPIRQAEERARQVDRLATLGRFTSSVAHEIRNPLTGIGTGVQCLARAIPAGDPQHENLRFIQHEIHRLDGIVQDLFNATHQRRLELVVAPVEDTLERAVRCVSPLFERGDVALEIAATPGLPPVAHDSHQLEQVFINLLKNAVEASAGGTKVWVRLFTSGPAGPATRSVVAPPTPGTLTVAVEDQGCGIPAEALATLFEPFFTTKRSGTGLGLYVCHDIVKRHGGQLAVDSEPGRGSRFILELPVVPHGGTP